MASAPSLGTATLAPPPRRRHGRRAPLRSWRLRDQIVFVLAWTVGIALCAVATSVVVFFAVKGIQYLRPSLLVTHPSASVSQSGSG
jgi:phosphate transport system permease protein